MRTKRSEFAAPLGSASRGRLEFARGASRVTIRSDDEMDDLVQARFDGVGPMVLADDGKVAVEYPRVSPSEWLHPNGRAADVALQAAIPWELVFSGGVSRLRADLTRIALDRFEIERGASDLELVLPEPRGVVSVRIGGGVSKAALHRPAGVAVTLSISGGVSKLVFDNEGWGAIGGGVQLASEGAHDAVNRYEIHVGGGANVLTIAESDR
jgi:hypothetical protein